LAAIAVEDRKEISAGQLKATADTELGTKQRKVNKKLMEYEEKGGETKGDEDKDKDKKKK
jgi:hypothetical protein